MSNLSICFEKVRAGAIYKHSARRGTGLRNFAQHGQWDPNNPQMTNNNFVTALEFAFTPGFSWVRACFGLVVNNLFGWAVRLVVNNPCSPDCPPTAQCPLTASAFQRELSIVEWAVATATETLPVLVLKKPCPYCPVTVLKGSIFKGKHRAQTGNQIV